jgi:hypothetical protein
MNLISDFIWVLNSLVVRWLCNGKPIEKTYSHPIRSAIPLADLSGVAVVESSKDAGRNNAVVFNGDGSERFRLKFPLPEPHGYCFDQMYYVEGRLNAFANLDGTDFRYEINEKDGEIIASYETR